LGYFSGFRPLRALLRQGFYINPSRRGPAVPAGGSPTPPGEGGGPSGSGSGSRPLWGSRLDMRLVKGMM